MANGNGKWGPLGLIISTIVTKGGAWAAVAVAIFAMFVVYTLRPMAKNQDLLFETLQSSANRDCEALTTVAESSRQMAQTLGDLQRTLDRLDRTLEIRLGQVESKLDRVVDQTNGGDQ